MGFVDLLQYTLDNYLNEKLKPFKDNEFNYVFTNDIPYVIYNELGLNREKYLVTSRCGMGNFATIPWIAIFDKEITTSAMKGYYVVILFNADMTGFYLTLNQGYTWFDENYNRSDAKTNISKMSEHFRNKLNAPFDKAIDLKSSVDLAIGYELGTIYSKFYNKNEHEFTNIGTDIKQFLDLLDKIKEITGKDSVRYNKEVLGMNEEHKIFYLIGSKNNARLTYDNGVFTLLKGSKINKPSDSLERDGKSLYDEAQKIYNEYTDINGGLIQDLTFKSCSRPGAIANGRATNGQKDWVDEKGIPISQYLKSIGMKKYGLAEFKEYFYSRKESFEKQDNIVNSYHLVEKFKEEYPLDSIKDLSLQAYVLGKDNFKDTLSYKLEFGEYSKVGPGIGGFTAKKFGIYYSNGGYVNRDGIVQDPEAFWIRFRDQLYHCLIDLKNMIEPFDTFKKYDLLQGMSMVITKLAYLYFPTKFVGLCSRTKLVYALQLFDYEYDKKFQAEQLSFILNENLRNDFQALNNENPELLTTALWSFLSEEGAEEVVTEEVNYWFVGSYWGGSRRGSN